MRGLHVKQNHTTRSPLQPRQQRGFTLVEIAIVLVIIGLLLGGILKGQELINSARVRNIADTTSGVQAAYFGFVDRYRQTPGDWSAANATAGIGQTIATGGNETGQIDHDGGTPGSPGGAGANPWQEPLGMWEQLSLAGFIQGQYSGGPGTEPSAGANAAPENPFNGLVVVGRNSDYQPTGGAARRHVLIGRFVPVDIMQELDTKMDDGLPQSGDLRATLPTPAGGFGAGANNWSGYATANCVNTTPPGGGAPVWNIGLDSRDCNGVFFF